MFLNIHTLITVGPQKGNFRYLNLIKGDKCKSNKRGLHFYFIVLFQKIVQRNFTWIQVLQNKQIHFVNIITGIIKNLFHEICISYVFGGNFMTLFFSKCTFHYLPTFVEYLICISKVLIVLHNVVTLCSHNLFHFTSPFNRKKLRLGELQ